MIKSGHALLGTANYEHAMQLEMIQKMAGVDVKGKLSKALSQLM
jgi:hypothetical protein